MAAESISRRCMATSQDRPGTENTFGLRGMHPLQEHPPTDSSCDQSTVDSDRLRYAIRFSVPRDESAFGDADRATSEAQTVRIRNLH